ncbi:MAG: hypothetical protein K2X47_04850 [Bdellovibrionales bacterium]|nr:hypothetical protein [Bdellovibrionales bacterium]
MMFTRLLGALALVIASAVSAGAVADSVVLDRENLYNCGGTIDLRQAYNGDLSLKINNLDTWACQTLRVYDYSSGRTLNSYNINSRDASYTLSKAQLSSLSSDCALGLEISGSRRSDRKRVTLPNCRRGPSYPPYGRITYEWSNKHNCKKMIDGQFSGELVPDYFCYARPNPIPRVTYEWSNAGNCKKMINGVFSGELVSKLYCLL